MPSVSAAEELGGLWLATLQRVVARASHDVKDALNGVSVNVEVIRSRAARPGGGGDAATVAPFAEAAGQQLDRLTTLIEAVLALGRAEREPVDVGVVLRRVATLCNASASAGSASIEVAVGVGDPLTTSVRGEAVRLALAGPLLELVAASEPRGASAGAASRPVRCTLWGPSDATADSVVVSIDAGGRRVAMPEALADAVRGAGVRWMNGGGTREAGGRGGRGTPSSGKREREEGESDFSLVFPRA